MLATIWRNGSTPTAPDTTSSPMTKAGVPVRTQLVPERHVLLKGRSDLAAIHVPLQAGHVEAHLFATCIARSPLTRPRVSITRVW